MSDTSSNSVPSPSSRSTPFLWAMCGSCAFSLLLIVVLNFAVDPFRVYHASWWNLPFPRDPQRLVPGLMRHEEFDAVVAGSSHCDNFLPQSMETTLGWQALRITLPGSSFPQQELAVRTALETGRVQHVLWGLDAYAFYTPPDTLDRDPSFPVEYYRASWRRPFNYLLNLGTAHDSIRCLLGRGDSELESRGTWYAKFEFSERACVEKTRQKLPSTIALHRRNREYGFRQMEANIREGLVPLVEKHSNVEFLILLPPVGVLTYLPEFQDGRQGFHDRLRFREALTLELSRFDNVRLYDFEVVTDLTQDLSRYMDISHYDANINDWMLQQIAADRSRLTPENLAEHQHDFSTNTSTFLEPILAGRHPLSLALRLEGIASEDSPERVAEAATNTRQ